MIDPMENSRDEQVSTVEEDRNDGPGKTSTPISCRNTDDCRSDSYCTHIEVKAKTSAGSSCWVDRNGTYPAGQMDASRACLDRASSIPNYNQSDRETTRQLEEHSMSKPSWNLEVGEPMKTEDCQKNSNDAVYGWICLSCGVAVAAAVDGDD